MVRATETRHTNMMRIMEFNQICGRITASRACLLTCIAQPHESIHTVTETRRPDAQWSLNTRTRLAAGDAAHHFRAFCGKVHKSTSVMFDARSTDIAIRLRRRQRFASGGSNAQPSAT